MIPHAGIIHASGWIIIKKIQVAITQEVSTIRNNLIFANNGLGAVVFIFIVMFSLLFMQDSDFVWKTFLLLGFIGSVRKPCGHIMLIRESELSLRLN